MPLEICKEKNNWLHIPWNSSSPALSRDKEHLQGHFWDYRNFFIHKIFEILFIRFFPNRIEIVASKGKHGNRVRFSKKTVFRREVMASKYEK